MLWTLVFFAVSGISVTVSGGGSDERIIAGSVAGGVAFVAIVLAVIAIVVCGVCYYRRVTSLEYVLSSKSREERRKAQNDEKSSLMSHEYDSVGTGDDISMSNSNSWKERRKRKSPAPREVESEYSEIRRDLITHHSRSTTPTDSSLISGIRSGSVSYGAVNEDGPHTQSRERQDTMGRESRRHQQPPGSGHTQRMRVNTSIQQSLKHSQSGTYVPTPRQRTGLIEPQAGDESHLYDNLAPRYDRLARFFEPEKAYWTPGQTTDDIYSQLSLNHFREIPRQSIIMLEQLGAGQFGRVYKGLWMCQGEALHVAVKVLHEEAEEGERVKFLQEAAVVGQFSHSNIIRLYGVVTINPPPLILLELALTDLHRYLRAIRLSQQYTSHLPRQLLQFSVDVASGMDYLSGKSFIHRDLAARNILLDFSLTCKIGDFGMARDLVDKDYYTSKENRPLPVKWMAPESLLYRTFSTASDVWSNGMVLYEIWSVGRKPYEHLTNQQVIDNLGNKMCHPPPPGCPRAIYTLMVGCWHPVARERVTFRQLYQSLCQPEEYLLSWPEEAEELPALARQLGADHAHSQTLHIDLQNKYTTESDMY